MVVISKNIISLFIFLIIKGYISQEVRIILHTVVYLYHLIISTQLSLL
jgi:hypothetical protein